MTTLSPPSLAVWVPGFWEWILILAVFLLLFGSKKLPELARSMGTSITQFKEGLKEASNAPELKSADEAKSGEAGGAKSEEKKSEEVQR